MIKALRARGVEGASAIVSRAERWKPYRGYATLHLWDSLGDP